MQAVVTRGSQERRAHVTGQDIYAVTAPIIAEAVTSLLAKPPKQNGVLSLASLFGSNAFLGALSQADPTFDFTPGAVR